MKVDRNAIPTDGEATIFVVLDYYGWEMPFGVQTQQIRCPNALAHKNADATPSARVFADTNVVHCFGCNFRVGIIGLVAHFEQVSVDSAKRLAEKRFGVIVETEGDREVLTAFTDYEVRLLHLLKGMPVDVRDREFKKADIVRALSHDQPIDIVQGEVKRQLALCRARLGLTPLEEEL